jgi:hypothetical protein
MIASSAARDCRWEIPARNASSFINRLFVYARFFGASSIIRLPNCPMLELIEANPMPRGSIGVALILL